MSRVIRVRYEKGVLKPLEPLELQEGEEAQVVLKTNKDSIAQK
ncbi:MAG: antitoxin family protein, partial [Crenarchaeota archaeon]|nr:antitoxin family protein [Thermoproteota archaeon]